MSPRSLDPISRRPEKPADKPAGSQPVSQSRKADTTRSIPNTADRDQMLAKAQANLRAKKDKQAKGRRKVILSVALIALIAFVGGSIVLGLKTSQQKQQAKQEEQQKQEILAKLAKLDIAKNLNDQQKDQLYKKIGAEFAAADSVGVAPTGTAEDQQYLSYLKNGTSDAGDAAAQAVQALIDARLALVKAQGYYEGYIYYYWYANTAVAWPASYKIANRGNPQTLAEDKKYAFDKANQDIARLKNGEITPEQLVDEVANNQRLRMLEDPNGSAKISSSVFSNGSTLKSASPSIASASVNTPVADQIAKMAGPGFSDITSRQYISVYDASKTPVDAGYFFIKLDKLVRGDEAVKAYESALARAQEQIK